MEVCGGAYGHDEIVFEGGRHGKCPFCVEVEEHNDTKKERDEAISERDDAVKALELKEERDRIQEQLEEE